ncbi:hypothetical protein KB206_14590 [Microvirga sp. STS02]|uniref:Uncharacterized protein n=2 Tax=Hymenobacter negativus TaxID=2795026 RepID=A0ABS0Q7F3_9BACT|nr:MULTISPECIES: hypothetical protein [Bacteria]MBH8558578.1 hypothetical protein [Hymenobacter negativus]MBH8570115.1 hypothetical protein [Hymenobacter negativus]MBR7209855.1 hypothetical protein [Microvirga sp. STS02]
MTSITAIAGPPSVVLVQTNTRNATITISRGPGKTETIEGPAATGAKNQAGIIENLVVAFTGLYAEGYELKNSVTSHISPDMHFETVTYVFVKP